MTSGTLTKLIEISPRLTELWPMEDMARNSDNDNSNVNLSLSITRDFIQITSDLYHQLYAWDEMDLSEKVANSSSLLSTNEIIAFR